jgi:hypothetical protein
MSDATQAELARQIQTNEELRRLIEQMRREIAAERRAREMADADSAALRNAVRPVIDSAAGSGKKGLVLVSLSAHNALFDACHYSEAGAALLTELEAARAFRRAYLHAEHAAALEDSGERLARSVASWYAEADRTQAALFAAVEAIDGPLVYDEMITK